MGSDRWMPMVQDLLWDESGRRLELVMKLAWPMLMLPALVSWFFSRSELQLMAESMTMAERATLLGLTTWMLLGLTLISALGLLYPYWRRWCDRFMYAFYPDPVLEGIALENPDGWQVVDRGDDHGQ